MTSVPRRLPALMLIAILSAAPALAGTLPRFSLVDLSAGAGAGSSASAINNRGQIAGSTFDGDAFRDRPWLLQPGGTLKELRHPAFSSGDLISPTALNARGQVVGTGYGYDFNYAWTYRDGHVQWLRAPEGYWDTEALAVNSRGDIAGALSLKRCDEWSCIGPSRAWVHDRHGRDHDLGTLDGDTQSGAQGINDRGQVAGWSATESAMRAVLWQDGTARALDTPTGWNAAAVGLNGRGDVAGVLFDGASTRPFLWRDGSARDLGILGSFEYTVPTAINRYGMLAGYLYDGEADRYDGFLYAGGQMRQLSQLVDGAEGWTFTDIRGLNDRGQIVGTGVFGGEQRAVLLNPLSPVPEPASWAMLAAGLAGLAAWRHARGGRGVSARRSGSRPPHAPAAPPAG